MSDVSNEAAEQHQYLIHAVWRVKDEAHGHDHYGHRVIHATAEGPWDPKSYINEFVSQEHPDWLPKGTGHIGFVKGTAQLIGCTVFEVSSSNEDAWKEWLEETTSARAEIDKERERAADMMTIAALKKKWGLDEPSLPKEG